MKNLILGLMTATLIGTAAQTASAHERWEHGRIVVEAPAIRYVAPPAVVYSAPVVCAPAPVIVAPAPVCVVPEPVVPIFHGPFDHHHYYHGRW